MDINRLKSYNKEHCWQYDIRLNNLDDDLKSSDLTKEYVDNLRVSDFTFSIITDKDTKSEMIEFIKRHEWLGTLSQYTTHWFACYHGDILAGVMLFNMPNAFSKLMGEDTKRYRTEIERL